MKVNKITDTEDHISAEAVSTSATSLVDSGSVVIVVRSGILRHSLPVAVTTVVATLNQDLKALTPIAGIDSNYVAWGLRRYENAILTSCTKTGTTVQSVEFPSFLGFEVPIPPLPEQHRIVAEIEKQFTRLDAAVAALKRAKANLKRYRASVLKAACEGRLVPTEAELARAERRDYEPADVLLQRILAERRAKWEADELAKMNAKGKPPKDVRWKAKYKEPQAVDASESGELPEGWCWGNLGAITEIKGGITKGQKRSFGRMLRSVPYLRVANVQRGFLDLTEIKHIDATENEIEDLRLESGDILFNEGGDRDKLGRGWVWNGEINDCIHQNHVFRARPVSQGIRPRYISWYGNTFGQRYFMDEGKQTTNLASINMTKLSALPVPLPPETEQRRIVDEIDRRFSSLDDMEIAIDHSLRRAERLRQSILKRAFEGKLVPQDPNDEPASVLLERIRAERATASPNGRETTRRKRAGKQATARMEPLFRDGER
jgi:type I restriction enzyme S subunit